MKRKRVPPQPIRAAIAVMLQPYGIDVDKLLQEDKTKINANEQKWLSPRDIEEQFSIGRWSIYRLIRSGCLNSSKLSSSRSGKVLVESESLKRYLASKQYIPETMKSVIANRKFTGETN